MKDNKPTRPKPKPEEYMVRFKGEALETLKVLAKKLDIPEDDLGEVVLKGVKVLQLPDDTTVTFKRGGDAYTADIKKL